MCVHMYVWGVEWEKTADPSLLFKKWFSKVVSVQPSFFSFFTFFQKSAVPYANVLFFKKCYCSVNIM